MPTKGTPVLIEELKRRYIDSGDIESLLKGSEISVLDEFLMNWSTIRAFNKTYYQNSYPKTVLCGINPGKNGAGKTGIPFVDFASLSKLIANVEKTDSERSAQFFYDVVSEFGAKEFYDSFYVTNISWVGYIKGNKNINYYKLPEKPKKFIMEMFKYEMEEISPQTIIAMSGEVQNTLNQLYEDSTIDIKSSLPHPNYCAFPKNYKKCKEGYIELLSKYIKA
jgi:hypothetical protein